MTAPSLGPGAPTEPMPLSAADGSSLERLAGKRTPLPDGFLTSLEAACADVDASPAALDATSRDWWLLAMVWAKHGGVPARAAVVARPQDTAEVAAIARLCNEHRVPLTVAGGRSGVCAGSVPLHGGVVCDLTGLAGVRRVDTDAMLLDVGAGTFGDHLEDELGRDHGVTIGHWPQSIALSTVGGWLACRGAGQFSNRYGKIEDMVVGLDVVCADGSTISTGGHSRAAAGPDLNQLFVGSEGTLGIITGARLRLHPSPRLRSMHAFEFESFDQALDACRRVMQRGARPAALRHYDPVESKRNFERDGNVVLVYDEGDPVVVGAAIEVVHQEFGEAEGLGPELVEGWLGHRNDTSNLQPLIESGFVVDTMEVTGAWGRLGEMYRTTLEAMSAIDGMMLASAHQSHAYTDGACLYFTFAGRPEPDDADRFYRDTWDAGTRAVLAAGGSLSHHHGVGLNRARFMKEALGTAFDSLVAVKNALDPNGILNPGKLGLPHPFDDTIRW